jgi:hypothetical protein
MFQNVTNENEFDGYEVGEPDADSETENDEDLLGIDDVEEPDLLTDDDLNEI